MKLRIVKNKNKYYCQFRQFFIWCYFEGDYGRIEKDSLVEAEYFMEKVMKETSKGYPVIVKNYEF